MNVSSHSRASRAPASETDPLLIQALSEAERAARQRPGVDVVVYRLPSALESSRTHYAVAYADAPAPAAGPAVAVVRRQPAARPLTTLAEAVALVLDNLTDDVQLAPYVHVEYYPSTTYFAAQAPRVFAYQFMSTAGRNVATWIPDIAAVGANGGLAMHTGPDGFGRPWSTPGVCRQSIAAQLTAARTPTA